jgi:hypothetical protein
MVKYLRSFVTAISLSIMSMAALAGELLLKVSDLVSAELTPQKLEIEVAQNAMQKVADSRKPVSIGSGSGDSPLSFVSMLKAINSRSFCATA